MTKSAKFPTSSVKIAEGESLLGKFVVSKTGSGYEKHKIFCKVCGCTLWTIPMSHGGKKYIVRTSLLDQGSVTGVLASLFTMLIIDRLRSLKPEVEFYTELRPGYLRACEGTEEFDGMPWRGFRCCRSPVINLLSKSHLIFFYVINGLVTHQSNGLTQ